MPDLQSIAASVASDLAAASLGMTLTVARAFDPDVDLKGLPQAADSAAHVTVIGRTTATTRAARRFLEDEIVIDVGIRARVSQDYDDEADDLAELTRKVQDYWWDTEYSGARFRSVEVTPWSVTHLTEHRLWMSLVSLTFINSREIPARGT